MKAALLGIDGDDTLWHSEIHFEDTQRAIRELLRDFVDVELFDASLLAQERRNLPLYGYGVKGFALSVIETAIDLSKGRVPARLIAKILGHTKDLLSHPVELLAQVESTLE